MLRLFFDPQSFGRLEVVPENADNFLDLVVRVGVYEKVGIHLLLGLRGLEAEFHFVLTSARQLLTTGSEASVLIVGVELVDTDGQVV